MSLVFKDLSKPEHLKTLACLYLYVITTHYFNYIIKRPTPLSLIKSTTTSVASSLVKCYICSWDPRTAVACDIFIYGMYDLIKVLHEGGPAAELPQPPPLLVLPAIEALVLATTALGQLGRDLYTLLALLAGAVELVTLLRLYYRRSPRRAELGSGSAEAGAVVREMELQERQLVKLVFTVALATLGAAAGIARWRFVSWISGAALCVALRA
ncbi:hypothetical protein AOQ84DRAFT_438366 [Glonium stellatum]|uniref:Uncharacterized protein n=1 Tax=Glonium stellatum TaxID=574774 RepID=A0A8E2JV63_9PEZI|nr:hypothetical protein AOQ84DRAFT_438366 [Glonium stellatum]